METTKASTAETPQKEWMEELRQLQEKATHGRTLALWEALSAKDRAGFSALEPTWLELRDVTLLATYREDLGSLAWLQATGNLADGVIIMTAAVFGLTAVADWYVAAVGRPSTWEFCYVISALSPLVFLKWARDRGFTLSLSLCWSRALASGDASFVEWVESGMGGEPLSPLEVIAAGMSVGVLARVYSAQWAAAEESVPELGAMAARYRRLEHLRWLSGRRGWKITPRLISEALPSAEVCQFLDKLGCRWSDEAVMSAAARGCTETLEWFHRSGYLRDVRAAFHAAAKSGEVATLNCLIRLDPSKVGPIVTLDCLEGVHPAIGAMLDEDLFATAASFGRVSVMAWLRERRCPMDERVCLAAAKNKQSRALHWLRSLDPPCPWSESDCLSAM